MRNLFEKETQTLEIVVPPVFGEKAAAAIRSCREVMSANEIRACAASQVACPGLDVRGHSLSPDVLLTPIQGFAGC